MYQISVEGHFDAAHYLREYQGKCENLHGHRYRVIVTVRAENKNSTGLAYDFTKLKKQLNTILEHFDHTCLNDFSPFDVLNPSAENIAETIYKKMKPQFRGEVRLCKVDVWESPQNCVTFIPDDL